MNSGEITEAQAALLLSAPTSKITQECAVATAAAGAATLACAGGIISRNPIAATAACAGWVLAAMNAQKQCTPPKASVAKGEDAELRSREHRAWKSIEGVDFENGRFENVA